jgi:hypothetical protein
LYSNPISKLPLHCRQTKGSLCAPLLSCYFQGLPQEEWFLQIEGQEDKLGLTEVV